MVESKKYSYQPSNTEKKAKMEISLPTIGENKKKIKI
jgi:hypothetical protein